MKFLSKTIFFLFFAHILLGQSWQETTDLADYVTVYVREGQRDHFAVYGQTKVRFKVKNYVMGSVSYRIDSGPWHDVESLDSDETKFVLIDWPGTGIYNLEVRWYTVDSEEVRSHFSFDIVPSKTKRYADGTGNTIDLWQGGTNPVDRPVIIVEGFDPDNRTEPYFYYQRSENFLDEIRSREADVAIVNFAEGGQDIVLNANILNSIINYMYSIQQGSQKIILIGLSMGGVISRYSLVSMEDSGTPLPVSHFVSMDSPQKGATMQRRFQDKINEEDDGDPNESLNSLAAKQMLIYNTYDTQNTHEAFYNNLNFMGYFGNGYPSHEGISNIGVSFAPNVPHTHTGVWLKIESDGVIFDASTESFDLGSGDPELHAGSYLPKTTGMAYGYYNPIAEALKIDNNLLLEFVSLSLGWFDRFLVGSTYTVTRTYRHPTFIPYESALDIRDGNTMFDVVVVSEDKGFHDIFPTGNDVITGQNMAERIADLLYLEEGSIIEVTFSNILEDDDETNLGGEFEIIDSDNNAHSVTSGESIPLLANEVIHTAETLEEKRLDWENSGINYQHHHWNDENSDFKVQTQFRGYENTGTQKAKFSELDMITIQTDFISSTNHGEIKIKDPWFKYVDGSQPGNFNSYGSPFTPGNGYYQDYGGLFLDQDPDETIVFYSVTADQSQQTTEHGQTIEWYFQNWQGTDVDFEHADQNETAVVFQQPDAAAEAVYKGQGISDKARATGYNNGRRIVKTNGGGLDHYHMVYEDDGEIWYTYSLDNGQTWEPEERISDGEYGNCSNPSIAYAGYGYNRFIVVWECIDTEFFDMTYIQYNEKYLDGSEWTWLSSPQILASGWGEARPVVTESFGIGNSIFAIAWRLQETPEDPYRIYLSMYDLIMGGPTAEFEVPGGSNNYPDIACFLGKNRINLVWAENGSLKYVKRTFDPIYETWSFSSEKNLTSGGFGSNFSEPSISMYNNTCHVTFKYNMMEAPCLGYGYFNTSLSNPSLNGLTCVEMNVGLEDPSISYASGYKTIFYERGGSIIRRRTNSYNWTETGYSTGRYPNVCQISTTGAVWTKYNSAPYFICSDLDGGGSIAKTSVGNDLIFDEIKRFYFPLTVADSDSESYFYTQLHECFVNGDILHLDENLESSELVMQGENKIETSWQTSPDLLPENKNLVHLYFKTENGKYLLSTLSSDELQSDKKDEESEVLKNVTFSTDQKLTGKVVVEFCDENPFVVNILKNGDGNAFLAKNSGMDNSATEHIPEHLNLFQNFPNPFNPHTQIAFDLPEALFVNIKVYNINGKMVNELVNDYRQAGRHQVVFNGNDLSSGVYVYRMRAGKRMLTGRMLLLK